MQRKAYGAGGKRREPGSGVIGCKDPPARAHFARAGALHEIPGPEQVEIPPVGIGPNTKGP